MQLLQKCLDISQSPNEATLRRGLISFAHHLDFPLVSAVLMGDHPQAAEEFCPYIGNRPADFMSDASDIQKQVIDPVFTRLRQQRASFAYDQEFYVNGGAPELWEIAAPWGFRTGISISMQVSESKIFLLGLDRERDLPADETKVARLFADLQTFAAFAQEAVDRLLGRYQGNADIRISIREREILLRVLEGRSNWVIAQLLNISENTVKFHLKNVSRRLGVTSRIVAATRANALGLLRGFGH